MMEHAATPFVSFGMPAPGAAPPPREPWSRGFSSVARRPVETAGRVRSLPPAWLPLGQGEAAEWPEGFAREPRTERSSGSLAPSAGGLDPRPAGGEAQRELDGAPDPAPAGEVAQRPAGDAADDSVRPAAPVPLSPPADGSVRTAPAAAGEQADRPSEASRAPAVVEVQVRKPAADPARTGPRPSPPAAASLEVDALVPERAAASSETHVATPEPAAPVPVPAAGEPAEPRQADALRVAPPRSPAPRGRRPAPLPGLPAAALPAPRPAPERQAAPHDAEVRELMGRPPEPAAAAPRPKIELLATLRRRAERPRLRGAATPDSRRRLHIGSLKVTVQAPPSPPPRVLPQAVPAAAATPPTPPAAPAISFDYPDPWADSFFE